MKKLMSALMCGIILIIMVSSCSQSGNNAVAHERDTIIIRQMKYFPATLYINKLDTVVWINQDVVSHDVTAFPNKQWTSDTIPPGGTWDTVMRANADYFCSIHPTMKGKIIVRQ